MFDIWYELPTPLRAAFGIGLMVVAAGLFFLTYHATGGRLVFVAYGVFVVGLVMLLFCNAGNTGGGYKF